MKSLFIKVTQLLLVLLSLLSNSYATVLFENGSWQFERMFPYDYNVLKYSSIETLDKRSFQLTQEQKFNDYPMAIVANSRYFVYLSYNVIRSLPPGKVVGEKSEVFHLNIFDGIGQSFHRVEFDLPKSSIDSIPYLNLRASFIDLCIDVFCSTVETSSGDRADWEYVFPGSLVELKFNDKGTAIAILEVESNESYIPFVLVEASKNGIKVLNQDFKGVPFNLRLHDEEFVYDIASDSGGYKEIFEFDLSRFSRGTSLGLLGESNIEGRIVWERQYYINALLSSVANDKETSVQNELWLVSEFEELMELCNDSFPGYSVSRYSLNRAPLTFSLHLGLMVQILDRYKQAGVLSSVQMSKLKKCNSWIEARINDENYVVEKLGTYVESATGLETCCTLYYRENSPFWADGANVPLNYLSGRIVGLALLSPVLNRKEISNLSKMLVTEVVENKSVKNKLGWRYWMFIGWRGWVEADLVSVNSPSYKGKGDEVAHISYRSIDAYALLLCSRVYICNSLNREQTLELIVEYIDAGIVNLYLLEDDALREKYLEEGSPNYRKLFSLIRSKDRVSLREAYWAYYLLSKN